MKKFLPYCLILLLSGISVSTAYSQTSVGTTNGPVTYNSKFVGGDNGNSSTEIEDAILLINPHEEFDTMPQPAVNKDIVNLSFVPKVFAGYRKIHKSPEYSKREFYNGFSGMEIINGDITEDEMANDSVPVFEVIDTILEAMNPTTLKPEKSEPSLFEYKRPAWFQNALTTRSAQEDLLYSFMIDNPEKIEYAYWDLPVPPVLLVEDRSFLAFINKQEVPEVNPDEAVLPEVEVKKTNWLHKVNGQLQFSQAYVSPNWYQGGNNYLALLFGFNWNVTLNQVYHPKILFQSDLTYKLALSSNPKGYQHKYTISEDNFQYNLNTGLKAAKNWYYSLNLQFKTQLLNNFEQNSDVRKASFLSPGDLNVGLGMSYNHTNKYNTFSYTLTISPASYNLKTCISDKVNHAAYNIDPDKKFKNEIGSNVELDLNWKITTNISYKTKVFMFTDYHYFLADWQNTFSFDINKFLSTQILVHLRYDGSTESYDGKWKKFMMREILSFGLSYTFSTKP